jgi:uncharacterized protein with HEPN domain
VEAIERIERYARKGRHGFEENELIQTWVVHNLEIAGEAAGRVSDALRSAHREVPWTRIAAMRNILAHDYFGLDTEVVWQAVEGDLPRLGEQIRAILDELPPIQ